MRNNILFLILMGSSFLLSSCASVRYDQYESQLQKGKVLFQHQKYQDAFKKLMPAAKGGNPEAQYAIGYMYFYGKGVVEDRTTARYWMQQSAAQGNPAAQNALGVMTTDVPIP